jgi:hypothetical protein
MEANRPYTPDTLHSADEEIINILQEYGLPSVILDDNELINTYQPNDNSEFRILMNALYRAADVKSPTGIRTPSDIKKLEKIERIIARNITERQNQQNESNLHSESLQNWAERERQKTELSLNIAKMKRLHDALKNPEVKDLLLKVMNRKITPEQAFAAIKANTGLNKQIMSLTLKGKLGGKSCVFRRKNKKTTFKSRRNAQRTRHTRRHRKSSTRRSMRK